MRIKLVLFLSVAAVVLAACGLMLQAAPTSTAGVVDVVQPEGNNLAWGKMVSASASAAGFPPEMAVDGIIDLKAKNYWSAGADAPQWIQIDLGAAVTVERVYLLPVGAGDTDLRILGCDQTGQAIPLDEFSGQSMAGEWISFTPPQPWQNVFCIRIETSKSAGWVEWREIEIIGAIEDEEVIAATPIEPPVIPTLIFHNGNVLSMEASMPTYQAIAIRVQQIVALGSDAEILALAAPDTTVIDLAGRTLMPGFIEGHSHLLHFAPGEDTRREDALQVALSFGLTTINEMYVDDADIAWLQNAEAEGSLPLRVNAFALYNDLGLDSAGNTTIRQVWFPANGPILDHDRLFRIPGIKVYVDGSGVAGRGCPALSEPYPADLQATTWFQNTCLHPDGDLYLSQDQLNQVVADAQAAGYRVAFHVMGDRGIDETLTAIENAIGGESNLVYRHAIQHNSLLRPDQAETYADLGIIASVRGYFNTCDQAEYPADYGPDRYEWAATRYLLPGMGVHAFSEGDFLWHRAPDDLTISTQLNPIVNLFGLVTREQKCMDGSWAMPEAWTHPDAISEEQALRMLTYEPAFAVSQENVIGTLEVGKYADLVILSDNPLTMDPEDLLDLKVWMTMVAGTTEYCAAGHEAFCP